MSISYNTTVYSHQLKCRPWWSCWRARKCWKRIIFVVDVVDFASTIWTKTWTMIEFIPFAKCTWYVMHFYCRISYNWPTLWYLFSFFGNFSYISNEQNSDAARSKQMSDLVHSQHGIRTRAPPVPSLC